MKKCVLRTILCLTFICILFAFCSCSASVEPDEQAYLIVLGIDKGEEKLYEISLLIMSSAGEGNVTSAVTTLEADSLSDAFDKSDNAISKKLDARQLQLILISREAIEEKGHMLFDNITNDPQIRHTVHVGMCEEKVKDVIVGIKPDLNDDINKYISTIFNKQYGQIMPNTTVADIFFTRDLPHSSVIIPILFESINDNKDNGNKDITDGIDENNAKEEENDDEEKGQVQESKLKELPENSICSGVAVIKNNRIEDIWDKEKTDLYMLAAGKSKKSMRIFDLLKIDGEVVYLKNTSAPHIKVKVDDYHAYITYKIDLVAEYQTLSGEKKNGYEMDELKKKIEDKCERKMKEMFELSFANNVDIFDVYKYSYAQFKDYKEFQRFNWNDKYKNSEVKTEVAVAIKSKNQQYLKKSTH